MRLRQPSSCVVAVAMSVGAACSSASDREGFSPSSSDADGGRSLPAPSLGGDAGESASMLDVKLTGTVYAPNGDLRLSNALVYVTGDEPKPIPGGVYCDECVALPDKTFALSAPDGTFTITTKVPKGKVWLVVQKGQFRRVSPLVVEEPGEIAINPGRTTLPGRSDPANGDQMPKMALLVDADEKYDFDKIQDGLRKLGIFEFDMKTGRGLLEDESGLLGYHIVFVPCGAQADPIATSPTAIANVHKFVEGGGKLYVTDWSYEFVRQAFPGYLTWEYESEKIGGAITLEWDGPATAVDQGLSDWLTATGDAKFDVVGNWTTLTSVNTMNGKDPKGAVVPITPKVWVTATKADKVVPATVSFENQCGRVLYSTYHTEGAGGAGGPLMAQEKALLYVLLEVSVCVGKGPGVN